MQHPSPLGLASSLTVLVIDWALYALVAAEPNRAALTTLLVTILASLLTYLLERDAGAEEFAPRSLRALGAGVAVAIPLPLYGTLLATASAAWTWLARRRWLR